MIQLNRQEEVYLIQFYVPQKIGHERGGQIADHIIANITENFNRFQDFAFGVFPKELTTDNNSPMRTFEGFLHDFFMTYKLRVDGKFR